MNVTSKITEQDGKRSALIVTALQVEYQAVRAHLVALAELTHPKGTIYECGVFKGPRCSWEVTILQAGAGNAPAALETERAMEMVKPDVAIFVGVAGGLKDARRGDVVVGNKVYDYESGKAGDTFLPRPSVGESSYRLVQRAMATARQDGWIGRIKGARTPEIPRALIGAIAAGEKVVVSRTSEAGRILSSTYSDALAVEMEGRGFLHAAHAGETPALVIRGVSDLLENKSQSDNAGWQDFASRHAAAFAYEVLAQLQLGELTPKEAPVPIDFPKRIPHEANPHFLGRASILEQIAQELEANGRVVLTGLGGMGKTQLATEYCYRYYHKYQLVWWIQGTSSTSIRAGLSTLAEQIGLDPGRQGGQDAFLRSIRQWLEGQENWLLVFDGIDEPQALIGCLPRGSGHIIISSRNQAWRPLGVSPIEIPPWSPGEAVAFLLRRTGHADEEGAATLGRLLAYLPLALEQAAAYIEQTGMSFPAYEALFRKHRLEVLRRGGPPLEYDETVATTWDLSFSQVEILSEKAHQLLQIASYYSPSPIPISLVTPFFENPLAVNDTFAILRRFSLITVQEEFFSVHRLVALVTQDRIAEGLKPHVLRTALELILVAFPSHDRDRGYINKGSHLLPHATELLGYLEGGADAPLAAARLANHVAVYLMAMASFEDARSLLEFALAVAKPFDKDNRSLDLAISHNLAQISYESGDLETAKAQYESVLKETEVLYGSDHPDIASTANGLGGLLQTMGDMDGAKAYFTLALAVAQGCYGSEHPICATIMNNLGAVLTELGEYADAKTMLDKGLALAEETLGSTDPQITACLTNLSVWHVKSGNRPKAIELLSQALTIDESTLGPRHRKVGEDLSNLGDQYIALGQLSDAKNVICRAREILAECLGPQHLELAVVHKQLGVVDFRLDDFASARDNFAKALAIEEEVWGPDHPRIVRCLRNLGNIENALSAHTSAQAYFCRATAIEAKATEAKPSPANN